MNELKMKLRSISKEESSKNILIDIERIAPFPVSESRYTGAISKIGSDEEFFNVRNSLGTNMAEEAKTPMDLARIKNASYYLSGHYDQNLDRIAKTGIKKRKIDKDVGTIISGVRKDYGTHATIKINKFLLNGDYSTIRLINADRYQRLSDPKKWEVVVLYAGSGRDSNSVGMLVRRDMDNKKNVSKNSIARSI